MQDLVTDSVFAGVGPKLLTSRRCVRVDTVRDRRLVALGAGSIGLEGHIPIGRCRRDLEEFEFDVSMAMGLIVGFSAAEHVSVRTVSDVSGPHRSQRCRLVPPW